MKDFSLKLWHRYFWKTDTVRFNPFLPFLAFLNFIIGIMFVLGTYLPLVNDLVLFEGLGHLLPPLLFANMWGLGLVIVFILHLIEIYRRRGHWGGWASMIGFLLWTYALIVYTVTFSILGILAIAAPQLFFWGWYYVSSGLYKKDLDAGRVERVS